MYSSLNPILAFAATLSLSGALPIADPGALPITGGAVGCRAGPGPREPLVNNIMYALGKKITVTCQASYEGQLWDKTTDRCFVPDGNVNHGGGKFEPCDGDKEDPDVFGEVNAYEADGDNPPTDDPPKDDGDGGQGGGNPGGDDQGTLPGLDATQSGYARAIIRQAKKDKVGKQGCEAGIATAWVETKLYMYANKAVPESLNIPHDKVGSDYDSVGLFQQRPQWYPDISAAMDPEKSAHLFFENMKKISGWETMEIAQLCRAIQKPEDPAYIGKVLKFLESDGSPEAICSAGGM